LDKHKKKTPEQRGHLRASERERERERERPKRERERERERERRERQREKERGETRERWETTRWHVSIG